MFKAIKLISCGMQRNCISCFENVHDFRVFMRVYSVVIFTKNDFDPWVTLRGAKTKVLVLAD